MSSQSFDFRLGKRKCWAQGHANTHPSVTLALHGGDGIVAALDVSVSLTPAEARAAAIALEAAATYAENVIAETGLGESAVETPTPTEAERQAAFQTDPEWAAQMIRDATEGT